MCDYAPSRPISDSRLDLFAKCSWTKECLQSPLIRLWTATLYSLSLSVYLALLRLLFCRFFLNEYISIRIYKYTLVLYIPFILPRPSLFRYFL